MNLLFLLLDGGALNYLLDLEHENKKSSLINRRAMFLDAVELGKYRRNMSH